MKYEKLQNDFHWAESLAKKWEEKDYNTYPVNVVWLQAAKQLRDEVQRLKGPRPLCGQYLQSGNFCRNFATHYINDNKNQTVCDRCLQDLIDEENNRPNRTR